MNFTDYLSLYGHTWMLELLFIIISCVFIIFNWKRISRLATSHMVLAAVLIWLSGLVLYCLGFAYEGSGKSLLSFLPRSALASVEMFLSHNELIEVSPHYKEDGFYMICFSLVHLAAVCLSAILILNTVGFRVKHYFMMLAESLGSRKENLETYVFWDINDRVLALASDIRKNYPEARIIFIRPTAEGSVGERLEMSEMVGRGSLAGRLALMRSIDSIDDSIVFYSSENMHGCLKKKIMARIIANTGSVSFFFFGNDEKSNLENAFMVYDYPLFVNQTDKEIRIYTDNRLGGNSKILEEHIAKGRSAGRVADWKFIDQSYLAVSSLRMRPVLHPVHCLRDKPVNGAVDTPFCAMILGFGRTGQELYSFFHEFSSFVKSDGTPARKNIIVVDRDINREAGPMCISSPGIFHTDDVRLIQAEAGTVDFWRAIKEYATGINCIGIALGNDDLDVEMTVNLYRAILQYSERRPKNVKLFLRVFSQENEPGIRRLADDYNSHKEATGIEIIPFGSVTETYSCSVIMEKDVLKTARMLNYKVGILRKMNDGLDEAAAWKRDFDMTKHLQTYKALTLAIDEVTRRVIQLHNSALYIGTMVTLAGIEYGDADTLLRFVELTATRDMDSTIYKGADAETQKLMDNLARDVYQRIVTSHWLMGYREADASAVRKDPVGTSRQKLTPLVKSWDNADEETRLMAYTLVDTGFVIALEHC